VRAENEQDRAAFDLASARLLALVIVLQDAQTPELWFDTVLLKLLESQTRLGHVAVVEDYFAAASTLRADGMVAEPAILPSAEAVLAIIREETSGPSNPAGEHRVARRNRLERTLIQSLIASSEPSAPKPITIESGATSLKEGSLTPIELLRVWASKESELVRPGWPVAVLGLKLRDERPNEAMPTVPETGGISVLMADNPLHEVRQALAHATHAAPGRKRVLSTASLQVYPTLIRDMEWTYSRAPTLTELLEALYDQVWPLSEGVRTESPLSRHPSEPSAPMEPSPPQVAATLASARQTADPEQGQGLVGLALLRVTEHQRNEPELATIEPHGAGSALHDLRLAGRAAERLRAATQLVVYGLARPVHRPVAVVGVSKAALKEAELLIRGSSAVSQRLLSLVGTSGPRAGCQLDDLIPLTGASVIGYSASSGTEAHKDPPSELVSACLGLQPHQSWRLSSPYGALAETSARLLPEKPPGPVTGSLLASLLPPSPRHVANEMYRPWVPIKEYLPQGFSVTVTGVIDYLKCPRKLLYRLLDTPSPTQSKTAARIGEKVHRILERFFRSPVAALGLRPDPEAILGHRGLRELLEEELNSEDLGAAISAEGPGQHSVIRAGIIARVVTAIKQSLEIQSLLSAATIATETSLSVEVASIDVEAGAGIAKLNGRIDRLDETPQGLLVVDYKTRASQTASSSWHEKLQLLLYGLLLASDTQWGPKMSGDALGVVLSLTPGASSWAKKAPTPLTISAIAVDEARSMIGRLLRMIADGFFPMTPQPVASPASSSPCRTCDFARVCPSSRAKIQERYGASNDFLLFRNLSEGLREQASSLKPVERRGTTRSRARRVP
jgi:RecB family exonuclease